MDVKPFCRDLKTYNFEVEVKALLDLEVLSSRL